MFIMLMALSVRTYFNVLIDQAPLPFSFIGSSGLAQTLQWMDTP